MDEHTIDAFVDAFAARYDAKLLEIETLKRERDTLLARVVELETIFLPKAIVIDGKLYRNKADAARALGVTRQALTKRKGMR